MGVTVPDVFVEGADRTALSCVYAVWRERRRDVALGRTSDERVGEAIMERTMRLSSGREEP